MDGMIQALAATEGISYSEASLWTYPGLRTPPAPLGPRTAPSRSTPVHKAISPAPVIVRAPANRPTPTFVEDAPRAVWAAEQADGGSPALLVAAQAGMTCAQLLLEQLPALDHFERLARLTETRQHALASYRAWQEGTWPLDHPSLPAPHDVSWILLGFVERQAKPPSFGLLETTLKEEPIEVEDVDNPLADLGDDPSEPGSINPLLEGLSERNNHELLGLTSFERFDWPVVPGEVEASAYRLVQWPLGGPRVLPVRQWPLLPSPMPRGEWSFLQSIITDDVVPTGEPAWHEEVVSFIESIDPTDDFSMDLPRHWYVRQANGQARLVLMNTKHQLPPYVDSDGDVFTLGEAAQKLNALARVDPSLPFVESTDQFEGRTRPDGLRQMLVGDEAALVIHHVYGSFPIHTTLVHRDTLAHHLLRDVPLTHFPPEAVLPFLLLCQPVMEEHLETHTPPSRLLSGDDEVLVDDFLQPTAWFHNDAFVSGKAPWAKLEITKPSKTREGYLDVEIKRVRGRASVVGEQVALLNLDRVIRRMRHFSWEPAEHGPAGRLIAPFLTTLLPWVDGISGRSTMTGRRLKLVQVEGEATDLWEQYSLGRILAKRGVPTSAFPIPALFDTMTVPWAITTLAPALLITHFGLTFHTGRYLFTPFTDDAIYESKALRPRDVESWVRLGAAQGNLEQLFTQRRKPRAIYDPQSWTLERLTKLVSAVDFFAQDVAEDRPVDLAIVSQLMESVGYPTSAVALMRQNLKDSPGLRVSQIPGFEWCVPGQATLLGTLAGTWPASFSLGQFLQSTYPPLPRRS